MRKHCTRIVNNCTHMSYARHASIIHLFNIEYQRPHADIHNCCSSTTYSFASCFVFFPRPIAFASGTSPKATAAEDSSNTNPSDLRTQATVSLFFYSTTTLVVVVVPCSSSSEASPPVVRSLSLRPPLSENPHGNASKPTFYPFYNHIEKAECP